MSLKINTSKLLSALQTVSKVISTKTSIPILKNVLIKVNDDNIDIIGTDNMSIYIKINIEAEVEKKENFCLPIKYFLDFISFIKDEYINIQSIGNFTTKIISKNSNIEIKGTDANEFPKFPNTEVGDKIDIKANYLNDIFNNTLFAVSKDLSRIRFTGVNIRYTDGKLIAVATDSFRLAEYSIDFTSHDFNIILPSNTSSIVQLITSNKDNKNVSMYISKEQVSFILDEISIVSLLIEGDYPNYKSIIPTKSKSFVTVNTEELYNEIKKSTIFDNNISNNSVNLEFDGTKFIISTNPNEKGVLHSSINATCEGEPVKVSCNSQFLLDNISRINDKETTIEFNSNIGPIIMRKKSNNADILFLVMPLRSV